VDRNPRSRKRLWLRRSRRQDSAIALSTPSHKKGDDFRMSCCLPPEGRAGFSRRLQPPEGRAPYSLLFSPEGAEERCRRSSPASFCRPFGAPRKKGAVAIRRLKPPAKSCCPFGTKQACRAFLSLCPGPPLGGEHPRMHNEAKMGQMPGRVDSCACGIVTYSIRAWPEPVRLRSEPSLSLPKGQARRGPCPGARASLFPPFAPASEHRTDAGASKTLRPHAGA
jgi:hypothetical protein